MVLPQEDILRQTSTQMNLTNSRAFKKFGLSLKISTFILTLQYILGSDYCE